MSRLTAADIHRLALEAGFSADASVMATAIALRESGGDPSAMGDKDRPHAGCNSYGLMQINVCPQGTPGGSNKGIPWREHPETLLEPSTNLSAALSLSAGGTNWRPWTTAPGITPAALEDVRRQIAAGGGPAEPPPGSSPTATIGLGLPDVTPIVRLFDLLADPRTWLRILTLALGAGLIVAGFSILNRDSLAATVDDVAGPGGAGPAAAAADLATP